MLRVVSFVLLIVLALIFFIEYTSVFTTYHSESISNVSGDFLKEQNFEEQYEISVTFSSTSSETKKDIVDDRVVVNHVPLPEQVKAIYMSACVAGTPSFRSDLVDLIEETELNSVMIDIKDYSGTISFPIQSEVWSSAWQKATCGAYDMKEFIADLHDRGIFVIGRITVFQDSFYTQKNPHMAVQRIDGSVWTDYKGLGFVDVAARDFWDDIIELSIASYNLGFDELNFDYIRYPSDGDMKQAIYPHTREGDFPNDYPANLEKFFVYLHEAMTDPENFSAVNHQNTGREVSIPWTSADTFGMTTTSYNDLAIGQVQERIAPYFDFIAPMVYPSHYPNNWNGYSNPNHYPYQIVYEAMTSGVARMKASTTPVYGFLHERIGTSTPPVYSKPVFSASNMRTWIQDFNYGGYYGPEEVRAQIQASYDAGVMSWMMWAPSNRYTKEALVPFYE